MVDQARHRESVAVVTEEARRYGGGVHSEFVNPHGGTEIDIEFPDLVVAVQFTTAVRVAFGVGVELRDAAASLSAPARVTVTVTDLTHRRIVRHQR